MDEFEYVIIWLIVFDIFPIAGIGLCRTIMQMVNQIVNMHTLFLQRRGHNMSTCIHILGIRTKMLKKNSFNENKIGVSVV